MYDLLQFFESKRQFQIILFLLIGSGTALSQFPPFQFLQKPGPYPVGLKVVNQYDPSRKFSATPDRPETPAGQESRPLQTLIWYPARQSRSKPMTVGDYVVLADREIHFDTPDQEHRTTAENGVPKHIMEIKFSPKSFAEIMRSAARTGEESAWEAFQRFAADPMHRYMTDEEKTINRLGYSFLQEKDPSSAVVLFKLNTKAYPDSANAWDSLGDGYEATNDVQDARMACMRSVELNPGNEHAKGELVKLRK